MIDRQNWTRTYPHAARFSTASFDHLRTKMDNKNSSDGRGFGAECTRQAGSPVAVEERMPGRPEFRISATFSATPAELLFETVAPNPCPQFCPLFTLPGIKWVPVGTPNARWRGGNTRHPLHFSAIADATGSGLGSTPTEIS